MRKISNQNLNAIVANQVIDQAIMAAGGKSPYKTVQLAKVILRDTPTHKLKTGVPIYAFVKGTNDGLAVKALTCCQVVMLDNSQIVSASEIHGDFTVGGVTYGVKDHVNGIPRYKVKRS